METNLNQTVNPTSTMDALDLNRVVLGQLKPGKHSAKLKSYSIASTSGPVPKQYLLCEFLVDSEAAPRKRAMFAQELGICTTAVAEQHPDLIGQSQREILEAMKEFSIDFWFELQDNPNNPARPYQNWLYYAPVVVTAPQEGTQEDPAM